MIYRRKMELDMEELKPELLILRSAADELKSSTKLKKLLAVGHSFYPLPSLADHDPRRPSSPSATSSTRAQFGEMRMPFRSQAC